MCVCVHVIDGAEVSWVNAVFVCMCVCDIMYVLYVGISFCMYVYVCTYQCVCVCVCVCVCMRVYQRMCMVSESLWKIASGQRT